MNFSQLKHIITQGENEKVEFKLSFSKSVIETLVAFSNAQGGKVLIGVANDGVIKGVSITEESVQKWINEIKQNTNPNLVPEAEIMTVKGKILVVLSVIEYPIKPVSYKDKYYKRVANANHKMSLTEVANEHLRTINSRLGLLY